MTGESEFDPSIIFSHELPQTAYTYTERDAALYALGIGACSKDSMDDKELKYVYHQDGQQSIEVIPTFAALFICGIRLENLEIPVLEYDPCLLLHGQQYIEIYKPLPSNGCIVNKSIIAGLHDKGKAAVLEIETFSYEKESGLLLCMNRASVYLRGAGGFSKSSQHYSYTNYSSNQTLTYKIPKSQPYAVFEECTQSSQHQSFLDFLILEDGMTRNQPLVYPHVVFRAALLYRLSGDYNPLHSDPMAAEIAGFSRPILHGLCTLGFAVRAIIKCICRGDQNIIKNISGRFLLHVYPGETLVTEMWLEGLRVLYQVKVNERNRTVLSGFVDLTRFTSSL